MQPVRISGGLIAVVLWSVSAQAAAPVTGRWTTQGKDAVVEIYECGAAICGRISKFLVTPPAGPGAKDLNNPDKALRNRTILGMNILTAFTEAGPEWKGEIYDPQIGKTYRSIVYKGKSGNLVVKGWAPSARPRHGPQRAEIAGIRRATSSPNAAAENRQCPARY